MSRQVNSDAELYITQQLFSTFGSGFEAMSLEQKRMAVRSIVKKVVWDGDKVHIVMFGTKDEEVDLSQISIVSEESKENIGQSGESENEIGLNTPWGAHSK